MRTSMTLIATAALALAGCEADRDAKGERVVKGEAPGTVLAASADRATGEVKVAVAGGRIAIDVPGEVFSADRDFDIDGAKLYPGSVVDTFDMKARETAGEDSASIRIVFTAPADPATVRAWFLADAERRKKPLTAAGDVLVGSTGEGKAYRISFAPADGGRTKALWRIEG